MYHLDIAAKMTLMVGTLACAADPKNWRARCAGGAAPALGDSPTHIQFSNAELTVLPHRRDKGLQEGKDA